jgi:transcriptional regulator with XRE-family HTH domain
MPALPSYRRRITVQRPIPKIHETNELGEAIMRRRRELGWLQRDLADALGACIESIVGWEKRGRSPMARHMPFLVEWLGFNPWPSADTFGGAVRERRRSLGMTQKSLGKLLRLDPNTVGTVERNKSIGRRVRATIEAWLDRPTNRVPTL